MNGNPLQANTDYPYAPAEMQNRSASPSARRLCGNKLSKESLRGNRASAQFVGGSRRSTVHRHPSRASLRDDIRTTGAPFTQPQKNSLSTPQNDTNAETIAKASRSDLPKTSEPRRSSIPVFRHTVSSMVSQAENERIKMNDDAASHLKEPHRDDFGIFEDPMDGSTPEKISKQHGLDTMAGLDPLENRKISQVLTNLEAIEESPKQNFQVRRLSLASLELGPTLKIHESAERLILGPEADKENQTESQLIKNSYHRRSAGRINLQQNQGAGKNSSFKKRTGRPSSTQELSYSASRTSSVNKDVRDKKIKSADLSYSLPTDHLHQESEKMKIQISRKNTASTNADDPFFDAQSSYKSDDADCKIHLVIEKKSDEEENGASVEKEPWISPLPYEPKLSLDSQLDHVNTDKPSNFQDKPGNDSTIVLGNLSTISANLLAAESSNDMPNNLQFYKVTALNQDPSTPTYSTDHLGSSNSSSFPPRSSSRTTPPDYTINSSRKTSPNLPSKTNPSPSEDFLSRQNKLGSSKGLASSQLGPGHVSLKRRSVARESNKSRNSLSKGMLSNFRGLFHKRHSDHESFSSIKTNGKSNSKTSIVSNGSPFPSVSEVHPIHRPTLASTNRSLRRKDSGLDASIRTPATPAFASPLPSEISTTTTLAMQLLESVRNEKSSPKKERSLELGTILVEAITQARDAERAMEEAKRAARKAEVAHALCEKSVGSIASRIQEWRNESAGF